MLPLIKEPGDVPELRQWLLTRTRPGGVLESLDGRFIHQTMKAASLWWVEEETCHLLAESAPTWPADSLLDIDKIPTKAGFAVFAHDMIGTDAAEPDHEVRVSAMCWGPVRLPPLPDGATRLALGIGMFTRMALHRGLDGRDLMRAAPYMGLLIDEMFPAGSPDNARVVFTDGPDLTDSKQIAEVTIVSDGVEATARRPAGNPAAQKGDLFSYIGRTDWVNGKGVEGVIPDAPRQGDVVARSMAEDRRLLAALWAITQTPVVTTVRTKPPRVVARRSTRKGLDPEVRILRLGGPHRENIVTGSTQKREWQHSWIVQPHFRWQACGPRWSERKLILVGPYTKGDLTKPLLGGERVWRVVPPPTAEAL